MYTHAIDKLSTWHFVKVGITEETEIKEAVNNEANNLMYQSRTLLSLSLVSKNVYASGCKCNLKSRVAGTTCCKDKPKWKGHLVMPKC